MAHAHLTCVACRVVDVGTDDDGLNGFLGKRASSWAVLKRRTALVNTQMTDNYAAFVPAARRKRSCIRLLLSAFVR